MTFPSNVVKKNRAETSHWRARAPEHIDPSGQAQSYIVTTLLDFNNKEKKVCFVFVCFSLSQSQTFWLDRNSLEGTGQWGLPGGGHSLGQGQRCEGVWHILGMTGAQWGVGGMEQERNATISERANHTPKRAWNTHPCRAWSRPWRKTSLCLSRQSRCWSLWREHVLEKEKRDPSQQELQAAGLLLVWLKAGVCKVRWEKRGLQ